jgi:hypothetical protein
MPDPSPDSPAPRLGPGGQLAAALVGAPVALLRLRAGAWAWLLLYILLAGGLLGGAAALLLCHQEQARAAILGYVLPESWLVAADWLIQRFLATQTRAVLVNALVSGTLVLTSVLLFPLKERVSAAFERGSKLTGAGREAQRSAASRRLSKTDAEPRELPLLVQGWQELTLLLLVLALQLGIIWLGYPPDPTRKLAATALSYLVLFFIFAVDFISPLLQRHGLRYSQILKTLLRHPFAALPFGAFFSAPAVAVGLVVARSPELSFSTAVVALFAANLISIVWGCVGGTWVGAALLGPARGVRRSSLLTRGLVWLLLLATLGAEGYVFGAVARSFHHKSQLLKCRYTVVPGTLSFSRPRLLSLLRGQVKVQVAFDLQIENPTPFDVAIEDNRLVVKHGETPVAESRLAPLAVPAQDKRVQRLKLSIEARPSVLLKGRKLLQDAWDVTLYLRVAEGLELPIYLKHTFARSVREQLGK